METNMKKSLLSAFILMATSSFMLSCSSSSATEEEDLGESKKIVNMLSEPQPIQLTAEQKVFANDNNQFTLNFLKTVNEVDQSGKSFIYSPLSITYVLGMVNDAATGDTEKELEQTLGFHKGGIKAVNEYCKKLIEGLPKVDNKVTLDIANAIFLNKDYTLKQQFQQDMQNYYDAKAEALDFSSPQTLEHINGWCNDKTKGMIPKILNDINPEMVSYLLNAIYFKADWASKFDPKNTKEETFTTEKGSTTLPMMHQNVLISYLKTNTYSAVILPYGSGLWNMTVLLPEEGKTTDDVIKELAESSTVNNPGWCETGGNYFQGYEVDLKLPRFETDSDTDKLGIKDGLVGLMKNMGINLAFDSYLAEIPNMCNAPVYIAMMRQKAKIKVNEEGSEAAAVTVAGMDLLSAGPMEYPKATFHANRPFVYVISEASSSVILFVGKFTGI
ncbi:MAG: serpin family protein [Prevotella sp.]|nr:serpin family protein [Prevotella sp.]